MGKVAERDCIDLSKDSFSFISAWGKWQNEIVLTYQKTVSPLSPLSKQKQLKSIKNMVITEALQLSSQIFILEEETIIEPIEEVDMI